MESTESTGVSSGHEIPLLSNIPKVSSLDEFRVLCTDPRYRISSCHLFEKKLPWRNTDLLCFAKKSGGMGNIFYAHPASDESPQSWVAIKELRNTELSEEDKMVLRFQDEIEFLRRRKLDSCYWPKLIEGYPGDINADPPRHYIMECFVPGFDLFDFSRSSAGKECVKDPQFVAAVILQIAAAILPAHREGVVLRDVKLENILIVPSTRDRGFIRLIDPGIIKNPMRERKLTPPRIAMGSPEIIPPEQWRGEVSGEPIGDMYSLGCAVFELLIGKLPFTAEDIDIRSIDAESELFRERVVRLIGRQHLHAPIPSGKLQHANPLLAFLATRLLSKDPKDRPDVQQVISAMREIVASSHYRNWVGPAMESP